MMKLKSFRLARWLLIPLIAAAAVPIWRHMRPVRVLSRADEKQRRKTMARSEPRREPGSLPA
jgi:hypothetical protein